MAQLKSLMNELDIINEKLMLMNRLLNNALEKFEELPISAAEHRNEAEESIRPSSTYQWHCSSCGEWHPQVDFTCPKERRNS